MLSKNLLNKIYLIYAVTLFLATGSFGQTVAFFDDFNRSGITPGGTPSLIYSTSSTGNGIVSTSTVTSTDSVLKFSSGTTAGRSILMGPISSFNSGVFASTLKGNAGLVTWTFNMRQDRGSASIPSLTGFDDQSTIANYGIATILVCNKANPLDTGAKGYAVVMGETGNDTTYDLISFTGGLNKNSNCIRLIKGMTLDNFKDIVSVKVTYNPSDNKWNMYQADGINSSADAYPSPTLISSASLGTVVNNSLVDTTMSRFGFLWNYGTLTSQNAYFDNFKVTINKPEITIVFPTTTILNDFIYAGAGPSASQYITISASNLTSNVVVSPPANFLICTTFNGAFASTPITLTQSGGSIPSATVFVKLKNGLGLGNYSETITLTSNNATSKTITCNGSVIAVSGTPTFNFSPIAPVSIVFPATEFQTNSDFQSFLFSATNLGSGTIVTFNTTNNFFVGKAVQDIFGVYINTGTSATLTADANGIISGQYIYVRYYPNEQFSANPVSAIDSLGYQSGTLTYSYGANGPYTAANLKGKIATYYFRLSSATSKLSTPGNWSASSTDLANNAFLNGVTTSPTNPFAIPGVKFKLVTNNYSANGNQIAATNVSVPNVTNSNEFRISGAGSKFVIGDPAFPGISFSFPLNSTRKITGTIDIDSASSGVNRILYLDTISPTFTFGTLHKSSEFHYQAKNKTSTNATFGKLFIDVDTLFINSSPSIQSSLTVSAGATLATTRLGNFCKLNMLSGASDTINGIINIQNTAGLTCGRCTPNSIGAVFNFVDATPNIIFGNNSIVQYAKTNVQTIQPFTYQNLEISGAGGSKTVDFTGGNSTVASVVNKLTVKAGAILATSDNLTLKSDSVKTAMLTPLFGTITGKVTVERFLRTKKAWRLLSSPTKHDGQTIKQSWMEGGVLNSNPSSGYGIQITSNNGTWQTDGFDAYTSTPSVKYLDSSTNNWVGITSTNIPFDTGRAYMTFVRGNRSVTAYGQNPTSTVLREKGTLRTGTITMSPLGTSSGNKFVAIGNPYASAVNLVDVVFNNSTNLDKVFYLWDPMLSGTNGLGGYVTVSIRNSGSINTISPNSGGSYTASVANLESGQGFIVHTIAGAPGSITFDESNKLDSSRLVAKPIKAFPSIRNNLFKKQNGETALLDGVINVYDSSASDNIDEYDALKLYNPSENISIKTNNQFIAIENRNKLKNNDTIFYQLTNLKLADYKLEFTPELVNSYGLHAYLEDLYLNTQTSISMLNITDYDFSVTTDAASYRADRFRLIFKHQRVLPVTFINLQAMRQEKSILLSWNVQNEININKYIIEHSQDGLEFIEIGEIPSNGLSHYQFNDNSPLAAHIYYRIVGIENDSYKNYSKVVKVYVRLVAPSISIVPNPIGSDRVMHLNLKSMEDGIYQIDIFDLSGKKVASKSVFHKGMNENLSWKLPESIIAGTYNIIITNQIQSKLSASLILTETK
jgi:hypothetical protein